MFLFCVLFFRLVNIIFVILPGGRILSKDRKTVTTLAFAKRGAYVIYLMGIYSELVCQMTQRNIIRYHINCHSARITSRCFDNNKRCYCMGICRCFQKVLISVLFAFFITVTWKVTWKHLTDSTFFFSFKICSIWILFQKVIILSCS